MHTAGLAGAIAVVNGKGGVFKTSIVANVGALAAASGDWRVLIVDLDDQGNQAEHLGLPDHTDEGAGLFASLQGGLPLTPAPTGRPGLDIVFGGEHLEDLEGVINARKSKSDKWVHLLADSLAPIANDYDLILFDCPPGDAALQALALVAAESVVIPTKSDPTSRKGLRKIERRFTEGRQRNPDLELLGVVMTGIGSTSSRIRAAAEEDIRLDLGLEAPIFSTVIRHVEGASNTAQRRGELAHELNDHSPSIAGLVEDYFNLTSEILAAVAPNSSTEEDTTHG